jgi:uncharacterized membrane protein
LTPSQEPRFPPAQSQLDSRGPVAALIVAYSILVTALLGVLPLGLDELLQAAGTRGRGAAGILEWVPGSAGGVPLGYLVQALFLNTLGNSVFVTRLPAALFSVLGCVALVWLIRELHLGWRFVPLLLFMALPLQLRYALEGRPYSQAVFFVLLCTILAVRMAREPKMVQAVLYGLALIAGVFTLPLLVTIPVAHLAWAALSRNGAQRRGLLFHLAVPTAAASVLLALWSYHAWSRWMEAIARNQGHFHLDGRLFLLLFRELCGGGYLLSCVLLAAVAAGVFSRRVHRSTRLLLGSLVVIPFVGILAIDAAVDYFFSIRQMVPLVPGLVLLAAEGVRTLYARRRALGLAMLTVILGVSVVHDVRRFRKPRENWQLAATTLKSRAHEGCLLFVPQAYVGLYSFFEPDLNSRVCTADQRASRQLNVTVVSSAHSPREEVTAALESIARTGRILVRETTVGGTRLHFHERPSSR